MTTTSTDTNNNNSPNVNENSTSSTNSARLDRGSNQNHSIANTIEILSYIEACIEAVSSSETLKNFDTLKVCSLEFSWCLLLIIITRGVHFQFQFSQFFNFKIFILYSYYY